MRLSAIIFFLACLAPMPALAQGEEPSPAPRIETRDGLQLRFFSLSHRPALATVEIVKSVLTSRGTVFPDARLNRLLVKDTPEALDKVQQLLQQVDLPAPIVRIELSSNTQLPVSGHDVGVALNSGGRGSATLRSGSTTSSTSTSQFLMVMSGEKGRIEIGKQLAYVDPYLSYLASLGLAPAGVVFQTVSTGFAVEPIAMGENIKLTIIPYISYMSPTGPGQIEVIQAASTVVLRRGETITLAASDSSSQVSSRRGGATGLVVTNGQAQRAAFGLILGSSGSQSSQSVVLQLSADIIDE